MNDRLQHSLLKKLDSLKAKCGNWEYDCKKQQITQHSLSSMKLGEVQFEFPAVSTSKSRLLAWLRTVPEGFTLDLLYMLYISFGRNDIFMTLSFFKDLICLYFFRCFIPFCNILYFSSFMLYSLFSLLHILWFLFRLRAEYFPHFYCQVLIANKEKKKSWVLYTHIIQLHHQNILLILEVFFY